MNTEAESGACERAPNGAYPEAFRIRYATLVAELPRVNREIQQTLIGMELKRQQVVDAIRARAQAQQAMAAAPVLLRSPQEILASSRDRAKAMIDAFFDSLRGRDKPGAWGAGAEYGDWEAGAGGAGSPRAPGPGEVSPMVRELIVSCVAAFIAIQVYAEHTASAEDIHVLMDSIHEMLKPRAIANSRFFNVIGGVLNDVAVLLQPASRLPFVAVA